MILKLNKDAKDAQRKGIADFCKTHESGIYTDTESLSQCHLRGTLELRKEEGKLIQSYALGNGTVKVIYDLEGNRK